MKALNSFKKYGLALLAMMVMLTAANAQSRYKHVPRVKVDKKYEQKVAVKEKKNSTTTTASYMNVEENTVAETPVTTDNSTVASTSNDVVVADKAPSNITEKANHKKSNKKIGAKKSNFLNPFAMIKDTFKKTMEKQTKLFKATDNKKAMMERWKLLMILFFIIGGALLITGIIIYAVSFSTGTYLGGAYWAGYIMIWLGVACITAAVVFLILGLVGVMS